MDGVGEAQAKSEVASGTTRQFSIPSCFLGTEDLRRLYRVLERRAKEAEERHIAAFRKQPGQSQQELEEQKRQGAALLKLLVTIFNSAGDWTAGTTEEVLLDDRLPDSLASIVYDSSGLLRTRLKIEPQDGFVLTLDFSRTHILDLTNLMQNPEQNKSSVRIAGVNDAWVKAVHDDVRRFFDDRKNLRGWLHSRYAYDLAVWLLGVPTALACLFHIQKHVDLTGLSLAVAVPLYIMLFLLLLLLFRFAFNYAKWVFPKIEGPTRRAWPRFHKSLVTLIGASLVTLVVESVVEIIGRHWSLWP